MLSFKDVAAAIPTLSKEELVNLKARINFLLEGEAKSEGREPTVIGSNAEEFYYQLNLALAERGIRIPPYSIFCRTDALHSTFTKQMPAVDTLLTKSEITSRRLKRIFLRRLAYCLITSLEDQGVNICLRSVIQNVNKLSQFVDNQFPGYIQGGMLRAIASVESLSGWR